MPTVVYIEDNGTRHAIEVEVGETVMQGAVNNAIPGIDADCGGACACATCHVYIDRSWDDRLPAVGEPEQKMLAFVRHRTEESRLSCRIAMTDALDGLEVKLPASQQ